MTNKIRNLAIALLLTAAAAFGQTQLNVTTLSSAINNRVNNFSIASATGTAIFQNLGPAQGGIGSPSTYYGYVLYVDTEAMIIRSISGTTVTLVQRGALGTKAQFHLSGARVFVGPAAAFTDFDQEGACTFMLNNSNAYLPRINTTNGRIYDCRTIGTGATVTGEWVWIGSGTMTAAPNPGADFFCTGTVGSAETEFLNGAACSGATTATASKTVTNYGVVDTLYVQSSAVAVGGASKDVATVFKNGSSTTLTCTIAAAAKACNDVTHAFLVVPGDILTVQFVTAMADTAANVSASVAIH